MQVPMQTSTLYKRMMQRQVVSKNALCKQQENQVVGAFSGNYLSETSEDRVKGHCTKEVTRRAALPYSSFHQKLSAFSSRKSHVWDAVLRKTSQKATQCSQAQKSSRSDCHGASSRNVSQENSSGAHTRWARAVVSISTMLSVISLEEMHLCEG